MWRWEEVQSRTRPANKTEQQQDSSFSSFLFPHLSLSAASSYHNTFNVNLIFEPVGFSTRGKSPSNFFSGSNSRRGSGRLTAYVSRVEIQVLLYRLDRPE